MNRLKNILPSHILKTIYSSLILSRLHYCNLVWGHKPNRLKTLQKRAIRIITKAKYNAHTDPLFKQLQTLKVEDIHTANKLKFFYNLENDRLPSYFWMYMFTANKIATINRDSYQQLIPRTVSFSKTIRFSLEITPKNTPPIIKRKAQTHSLDSFKKYVKNHLLSNYDAICTINRCYICNNQ